MIDEGKYEGLANFLESKNESGMVGRDELEEFAKSKEYPEDIMEKLMSLFVEDVTELSINDFTANLLVLEESAKVVEAKEEKAEESFILFTSDMNAEQRDNLIGKILEHKKEHNMDKVVEYMNEKYGLIWKCMSIEDENRVPVLEYNLGTLLVCSPEGIEKYVIWQESPDKETEEKKSGWFCC